MRGACENIPISPLVRAFSRAFVVQLLRSRICEPNNVARNNANDHAPPMSFEQKDQ